MSLGTERRRHMADPSLSSNEQAHLRCQLAVQLEDAGDYDGAVEAMGELWQGVGKRPMLEALDEHTRAQVLLRVGSLTGWVGSAKQIDGAQELAKDLIGESVRAFEEIGKRNRAGEARSALALCYWREGAFDEARVMLQGALGEFDEGDIEQRAITLLRRAMVERSSRRLNDALRIYNDAAPLFEAMTNHLLIAHFHHGIANVLNQLSSAEHRDDYRDQALIQYAAASFHFEQAGHIRYQACVDINLGFLYVTVGRFSEAHDHLDRAQMLLTKLKDDLHLAQVDETRARAMLAEGRIVEAAETARRAVRTLEKGDELSLLAEALTTQGLALARLDYHAQARGAFDQAIEAAEKAGDFESAGLAALTLIEQLGMSLSNEEAWDAIEHASVLLEKTKDIDTVRRLARAAFRGIFLPHAGAASPGWTNFSFRQAVHRDEAYWIKLALKETGGKVTPAARLLGIKHQFFIYLLNTRHRDLLEARSPIRKRRRHLFSKPSRIKRKTPPNPQRAATQVSILHVEDNKALASLVKESLELEGWMIETCVNGDLAFEKISSDAHYDLILLDNYFPGLSGIQLVQRARSMAHRRHTPIVMFSATVDNAAAQQAGADLGLRKPEDIGSLTNTIARLLKLEEADGRFLVSEQQ